MSSFIDSILRPLHQAALAVKEEVEFEVEKAPQEWKIIRRHLSAGTLQANFDKGDLALIAAQAIAWYDRLRNELRNEQCLTRTPVKTDISDPRGWGGSPEDGLTIPEQEALKEEVVRLQAGAEGSGGVRAKPSSPRSGASPNEELRASEEAESFFETFVERRSLMKKMRRLEDRTLESEMKIEKLHMVLGERTRRVIKLEQLMRERTRQVLALQATLADATHEAQALQTAMKVSVAKARAERDAEAAQFSEMQQWMLTEIRDLESAMEWHRSLWTKATASDGGVVIRVTPRYQQSENKEHCEGAAIKGTAREKPGDHEDLASIFASVEPHLENT